MTSPKMICAILIGSAAVLAGCERQAAAPAAPVAAQSGGESDDKLKIQLDLGKQGSVDYEKKGKE